MLEQLYIKDFALIRELRINLGPRMNIITGETGAGKSIILGALDLVLGSKATTDLIRSGASRAVVEAGFYVQNDETGGALQQLLRNNGLDIEDQTLILRREITTEGRGRSYVNSSQVPVSFLKNLGRYLVDIHGQNEHQNILRVDTHRAILDRYAGLEESTDRIRDLYRTREELLQRLTSVSLDETEKNRRMQILDHEIQEIEQANLKDNRELEELSAKENVLENAEVILKDLSGIFTGLQESDESLLAQLSSIEKILEKHSGYSEALTSPLKSIREAYYLLEDAATEMRSQADNIQLDPEELMLVRERIDVLQNIYRKYGNTYEEVTEYLEKIKNEYQGIELSSEEEQKIRKEISRVETELIELALATSARRKKTARELEQAVQNELSELGMADTRLRLSMKWQIDNEAGIYTHPEDPEKKYRIHPTGLEIIEFLISAGKSDALRPLRKVASGGEMSRIMLALKKVVIESEPVMTMIFDEVDAGVGGGIAEAVGKKLASLSANSQLLVITHLQQIAAMVSDRLFHFKVTKDSDEGTRIYRLNKNQRIEEIARMIAGETITESAMVHARSLLSEES